MIAALIPARQAARVDPVQALQKGKYQVLTAARAGAGDLAAAPRRMSPRCLALGGSRIAFYAGYCLVIAVALLLGPLLSLGWPCASAAAEVGAPGRRRAGGRQPDSSRRAARRPAWRA
jgi:hypothetical protein